MYMPGLLYPTCRKAHPKQKRQALYTQDGQAPEFNRLKDTLQGDWHRDHSCWKGPDSRPKQRQRVVPFVARVSETLLEVFIAAEPDQGKITCSRDLLLIRQCCYVAVWILAILVCKQPVHEACQTSRRSVAKVPGKLRA